MPKIWCCKPNYILNDYKKMALVIYYEGSQIVGPDPVSVQVSGKRPIGFHYKESGPDMLYQLTLLGFHLYAQAHN